MSFDLDDVLFAAAASLPIEARARFLTDIARLAPGVYNTMLISKLQRAHMAQVMANGCPTGDHVDRWRG